MHSAIFSAGRPERLISVCEALGYGEDLRTEDFPVLMAGGVVQLPVACFGRPEPKDISTATIAAGQVIDSASSEALREGARALAAPIALLDDTVNVQLWRIAPRPKDDEILQQHLEASRLADYGRLLDALSPESLVAHKHGLSGQMALFDRDVALLSRARADAADALSARVSAAMADQWPHNRTPSASQAEAITRTVVQALALLVARDKMTADRDLETALAVLQERYRDAVVGLTDPPRRRAVLRAASIIGQGVRFDTLDATILGDVYEGTFLQDATRRHLGAYYTPPPLARRMVDALPVEEIDPTARRALDLTVGSGTLLLAIWDRFAEAEAALRPTGHHGRSPGRLTGFDQDPFAVELARLALIIHDAPGRPDWSVTKRNGLRPRRSSEPLQSVVIGNPPWGFSRPEGMPTERATSFLDAMLRWCAPGGFVACLLPASWLTARVARESRANLRRQADLFEAWRLPETTFEMASVAPCVIFAQKQRSRSASWLYRRVHRDKRDAFYDDIRAAPGVLVRDEPEELDAPFRNLPLVHANRQLVDVAQVRRGVPVPHGKLRGHPQGNVWLLPGYRHYEPFSRVDSPEYLVRSRYPEDFSKRGEDASFWLRPKLLMATTTNVDGVRVRTFMDELGVVPRNSMTAVVPYENDGVHRYALLGILNSSVVRAWLETASMRWIGSEAIERIPIPGDEHFESLASFARRIANRDTDAEERARLISELDAAVGVSYGLPEPSERQLEEYLSPPSRLSLEDDDEPVLGIGTVLGVDGDKVLLHIPGLTSTRGDWCKVPPALPGWACRPGKGFQVLGLEDGWESALYFPQEFAWRAGRARPEVETPA